jgi:predicted chitinase
MKGIIMPIKVSKEKVFNAYRKKYGPLQQKQVDGIEFLLDKFEKEEQISMVEQYAYILATVQHETASTYQPIKEYGLGKGRPYGAPTGPYRKAYYGRGYVQLTWQMNYKTMGQILGIDLLKNPDLALDKEHAYAIMIEGMKRGLFTKHKLDRWINDDRVDYVGARRIINGTDRDDLIAGYAKWWEKTLTNSSEET